MTGVEKNKGITVLFSAIALFVGADLVADAGSGTGLTHMGLEGLGTLLAVVGAGWSLRQHLRLRAETSHWRAQAEDLLAGAGTSVEEQFERWTLSTAEAEVALLLLKGLSFKEVASVRGTGERTSREQARNVYKKAKVAGRAELAAWFIEDLLPD